MKPSTIEWLSNWYQSQCNGDWEHTYGIKIGTIDNPGWEIEIDLTETKYKALKCPYAKSEKRADDWYAYEIKNFQFKGYCSPNNLENLISIFAKLVEEYI